jgi:hypothetical protein
MTIYVESKRVFRPLVLLAVALGVIVCNAYGYVPEGPQALDLMVKKLSGPDTLRVEQIVVIEDPDLSENPLELRETCTYMYPDRFRSDTWYKDTHRVLVVSGGQALTVIDDRIAGEKETRFDGYKDLLLYHFRKLLLKAMLNDHIDVGLTSLGRFDDRIVIVIGAQYPDESVSQVWLDKERFVPLRWISCPSKGDPTPAGKDRLEFVYRNWQKWDDIWWPSRIESYHNQQLVRQISVRKVEKNVTVDEQSLSISHLKTLFTEALPETGPETPISDVDEVQETIDEFKKKFEN